jgi:predicted TPR repeat methyltransferase
MHSEFNTAWVEIKACPLCEGQESVIFDQRTEHGIEITNRMCLYCGLIYQNPHMDSDSLKKYYQRIYERQHQRVQGVSVREIEIQRRRANHLLDRLTQHATSFSHHLDIGSSTGMLLEQVRERFKSQPVGVELADTYRNYAHNRGLEVYPTLGDLPGTYEKQFDLITMVHVLEHLIEPRKNLVIIRERWLSDDGLLLVEVPNLFFHATFEFPHLTHFYAGTLSAMLEQSGYKITQLVKHGAPRSRRFPLNLLFIARPGGSRSEKIVASPSPSLIQSKRRMGRFAYLAVANVLKILRWGKPSELEVIDRARK